MTYLKTGLLAVAAALALAGCGGGDAPPTDKVTALKVFGDSLADVGTFNGVRATVQGADQLMYPERIAAAYSLSTHCNFYRFTGTSFGLNPKAGCSNYAIGGGVINHANPSDPRGISLQLITAGSFARGDLLLVDGGGNDAAALVGAYLAVPKDQGASYAALLGTLLPASQVSAAMAGGAATIATIGGAYMQALAAKFHTDITNNALNKGATRVALLNMPGITNTPRFQMVLDGIALASGGGASGAAARGQAEALFKGWIEAFNAELAKRFANDSRVAVIDFYAAFNEQIATPSKFGLSNVKTPACPVKGAGADGLPTYDFATCTATALSASPPAGASADWWKSYAFSDGFHPTPYGHQLTAQLITQTLSQKGWL